MVHFTLLPQRADKSLVLKLNAAACKWTYDTLVESCLGAWRAKVISAGFRVRNRGRPVDLASRQEWLTMMSRDMLVLSA